MRRGAALAATGLLAVSCAMSPQPPVMTVTAPKGPDRAAVARATSTAARQVQRCYRSPRVPREGKQITTVIRVRYAVDGTLTGLPELVRQEGVGAANRLYAPRMAEAAILAAIRCVPLTLPAELHDGGWDDFELTFAPRSAA